MKKIICLLSVCLLAAGAAQADLNLIVDDFSSDSFSSGTKFLNAQVDAGWHKRSSNGPDWNIGTGTLNNAQNVNNDDKPAFILNSVTGGTASDTKIKVTFDYDVAVGSTLYFHSALMTGALGTLNAGVSQSDGSYAADQFVAGFGGGVNLAAGQALVANDANAIASFAGSTSGSFSQTFDISGYTGIGDITDVSHILAVFASNNNEPGGAISVDNLSITAIPEPAVLGMVVAFGGGMLFIRRLFQM